jgi:hypothetical protein
MNFQGLFYDLMGSLVVIESNDHGIGNIKHDVVIDGTPVSKLLVHGEFPYDWGIGKFIYITFLSAIFMGKCSWFVFASTTFYSLFLHAIFGKSMCIYFPLFCWEKRHDCFGRR